MQFLYPIFLWSLLALAIPIIIHLFYFRRFKKVYFTNVRFLKEIKQETSSRNKLKNLLILLMRCLGLISLIFAFAQPFIPTTKDIKKGEKTISIFVDNSFSMNAEMENVPLLDLAKERAKKIINAYSPEDKFQILTNDFEGKHLRLVTQDEALNYVEEINISPASQQLSKVIARQKQVLKGANPISYLISDFQKSITDINGYRDTTVEINLIPVQHTIQKNISIDSVWFVAPTPILNETNNLVVKLSNHSNEPVDDVKTSIFKDGQEKPIGLVNIDARSSVTDTVPLSIMNIGIHDAEIRVTDFPVQFDDKYYISFLVKENIKVLALNTIKEDRYLSALFKGIGYFTLDNQNLGQIQYQKFKGYDLIILNDLKSLSSGLTNELVKYIEAGGKVLVMPALDADINSYNAFFSLMSAQKFEKLEKVVRNVSEINTRDFVFSEVYESVNNNLKLPSTKCNYIVSRASGLAGQNLLTYRDGLPYVTKYVKGEGQLFVCVSPLSADQNDLVTNAEVFVPMLYKMALSKNKASKLAYTIGADKLIEIDNKKESGDIVYKLKGKSEFIPSQISLGKKVILDIKNQVINDGQYELQLDNKVLEHLAFNYNRKESNLDIYGIDQLDDQINNDKINILDFSKQEGIKELIGEKDQGIVLWKWFLWAALFFLLMEIFLIRLMKN